MQEQKQEKDAIEEVIYQSGISVKPVYTPEDLDKAGFDYEKDLTTVETYEPAVLTNKLTSIHDPVVGINLSNLKTGNQFIDKWLDIRLYSRSRLEHPYDLMYVRPNDYFYIGFHARNTRRLPYDVECMIGIDYASRDDVDPRYLAKVI